MISLSQQQHKKQCVNPYIIDLLVFIYFFHSGAQDTWKNLILTFLISNFG